MNKLHLSPIGLTNVSILLLEFHQINLSSLLGKIGIPIPTYDRPGIQAVLKGMDDFKSYPLMGCHGLVIVQGNGGDRKINSNSCSFFILGSGLQLRTRYSILMDYFYFH